MNLTPDLMVEAMDRAIALARLEVAKGGSALEITAFAGACAALAYVRNEMALLAAAETKTASMLDSVMKGFKDGPSHESVEPPKA